MDEKDQQVCEMAHAIRRTKQAVEMAFGERAAKDPLVVAEFLKADAIASVGRQIQGLRDLIASGEGAITVGIDKPHE